MISTNDNIEKIEFRIKDSGIGIEDSFKNKIFENFSQGDSSSKKKHTGVGLGLIISKQLASLMNGDICFESKIGEGSTFVFSCEFKRVSVKDNTTNENQDHSIIINNCNQEKTILCVEDNIVNQEVIANIVKRKGYKYIRAYSEEETLEILKNSMVDLILMDIQMPMLDGYETAQIIRKEYSKEKPIPIIAMTAYTFAKKLI